MDLRAEWAEKGQVYCCSNFESFPLSVPPTSLLLLFPPSSLPSSTEKSVIQDDIA